MRDDLIGANLRDLRTRAGLSLSAAAKLTGVSKAMLGQIERGESSPTIATLWKITRGFHLPLTALIEGACPDAPRRGVLEFPGSISVKIVFPFDPQLGAETFHVSLKPGQSHESQPHDSGVTEEVFVLEGRMEVLRGGDWVALEPGQGLRFAADQPHGYRSLETGAAFLNMHHYRNAGLFRAAD